MQWQERNLYGRPVPEKECSSPEDAQDVSINFLLSPFIGVVGGGVVGGCY